MTATHSITIADAGERTIAFRRARINSFVVRTLRWLLPVCACLMLGSYALFMQRTIRIETKNHVGIINTGAVASVFDNLAMSDPSYEGYNKKDGSRYRVAAKKAITDLSREKPIELHEIDGSFQQATGDETTVRAKRGLYDQKQGTLDLAGGIRVKASNGVLAALNSAKVHIATSEITSVEPVRVELPSALVRSNAMRLNQRTREIVFEDGVAATLRPETNKPAIDPASKTRTSNMSAPQRTADLQQRAPGATAGQPPPTGIIPGLNSGAPVDITSALLAVSDTERRAVFTGNVRASQSGRLLEAPRLSVSFDGGGALQGLASGAASADPATPGKSDQPRRQLREIKATGGVRLTQIGNQVLARDAVFNVVTKQAELTGGVNITSAAGRSIVADHAAIDTATNRVVLTGNVVAKQEQNLLRGSQMIYEPKLGRMYLAAPAVGAAPPGDIFARFRPPVSTGKRKSAAAVKPAGGLAFTTNPDAPVEIKARSLDVEDLKSVARFEGGVRARQGEFTLMTPVLTAHYDGQIGLLGDSGAGANAAKSPPMKLRFIRATNPVTVTSGDDMQAEGDAAEFDMLVNVVTISGNVILKRGRQIVHGDKLEIDLNTGLSRIRNSASATNERKPLSFGAAPQISSTRGTPGRGRACGGQMCAVIYPQELQKERDAKKQGAAGANTQGRPKPKIESGWSTSTRTN